MKKLVIVPLLLIVAVIIYSVCNLNQAKSDHVYSNNQNSNEFLILANKNHPLSSSYIPENLTIPNVEFSPNASHEEKMMQGGASSELENLFKYAHKKGINLYGVSAYRSYKSQKQVYDERVRRVGKKQADEYVAYPGTSEHQTGLAIDVTNEAGFKGMLTVDFGQTREGKWLKANAYRFGFIMRYPKEKESITGYSYESWHIRYVGVKVAKEIYGKNIVLEEYLGEK
ncbi:M15 family metallopeptidase [Clostridium coskatii]|uniref:D-alanyl-D-alanine carboxypeptidase n=1 Tax=Clostridium coskatii TaxID=1705578 RepID=A0A166SVQ8_9CLOT|nr:M15 family metallopeptidase [Clostridium coskatii]OAA92838.1 D-alanyl-D-alanine carboxypeptidase [Clostridium coskatii]OBR95780.1 D-alanyl-D-alanine carboxypeptidase [Clostridium coskatii]